MPETQPSNAKIYDRPEKTGPPPILIVLILAVIVLVGYLLYRNFYHPARVPAQGIIQPLRIQSAFLREVSPNGR